MVSKGTRYTVSVSVPFRGSCSEIDGAEDYYYTLVDEFPSPFGVRVLKYDLSKAFDALGDEVSVPFRGSCSEIFVKISMLRW